VDADPDRKRFDRAKVVAGVPSGLATNLEWSDEKRVCRLLSWSDRHRGKRHLQNDGLSLGG
jgi:hypothetical protein